MKQAFLSVSKKEGLAELARGLLSYNIQLLASDGTAAFLQDAKIPVTAVSDYLKLQPFLEGRVKTLHPAIYGGILANRAKPSHLRDLEALKIELIDFVIVDLYPFEDHLNDEQSAIENIDIGGISLIRAAAKNYACCTVLCNPQDYGALTAELKTNQGETTIAFRKKMAIAAFAKSSRYDEKIHHWLVGEPLQPRLTKIIDLSYGENPHQTAGFFTRESEKPSFTVLQGKPLSYNNILDLDAGINLVQEFSVHAATIIKHTNPCGLSIAENPFQALHKAFHADSKSAFGGIVVLNTTLDAAGAEFLVLHFLELIAAPNFSEEALALLNRKPNLRLLCYQLKGSPSLPLLKSALNGVLIQEPDHPFFDEEKMRCLTKRQPSKKELKNLIMAFKLVKHVKSNAIAILQDGTSLSIGAGQTSRVDAVLIALDKISHKNLNQAVLAADGFFPFADSIELIAKAGIKTIIQPGGSIRDKEIIAACDRLNISMVFTGRRSFRH